jgi:hypothetical protein
MHLRGTNAPGNTAVEEAPGERKQAAARALATAGPSEQDKEEAGDFIARQVLEKDAQFFDG